MHALKVQCCKMVAQCSCLHDARCRLAAGCMSCCFAVPTVLLPPLASFRSNSWSCLLLQPSTLCFAVSTLPSCCRLLLWLPPRRPAVPGRLLPHLQQPVLLFKKGRQGFSAYPSLGNLANMHRTACGNRFMQHAASQASTRHGAAAIGIGSTSSRYAHMHATMHAEMGRRHGMTASSSPPRQLRQCNSQTKPSGPRSGCRHAPVLCAAPRAPRRGRVGQMGSHLQLSRLEVMLQWHTQ